MKLSPMFALCLEMLALVYDRECWAGSSPEKLPRPVDANVALGIWEKERPVIHGRNVLDKLVDFGLLAVTDHQRIQITRAGLQLIRECRLSRARQAAESVLG